MSYVTHFPNGVAFWYTTSEGEPAAMVLVLEHNSLSPGGKALWCTLEMSMNSPPNGMTHKILDVDSVIFQFL